MRGVFGVLLIGGGVILMYGLFTGKITFPGGRSNILGQTPQQGNPAVVGGPKLQNPNADGSCPKGLIRVTVSGGKIMCQ